MNHLYRNEAAMHDQDCVPAGSLAQICEHDERVAGRFELYYKNMELTNGFNELTNAKEQAKRFNEDNAYRAANGLKQVPVDTRLIAALEHGLPQCAGVALGIDRLVMLATNKQKINQRTSNALHKQAGCCTLLLCR